MAFFSPRRRRSGDRAPSPLAKRGFLLLLLTTLGIFANNTPLLSVVPLWSAEGGSQHVGVGTATGVTMATTVGIQLCMGWLLARFGPHHLMAVGALLLGVPTFGYPLSTDLTWILAVSAVRGLGFGIVTVAGSALVAELTAPEQRGRAVGWYGISVGLPQLVFLPLGVWVAETVSFTVVFVVTGALSTLAAPLVAGIPRPRPASAAPHGSGRAPGTARPSGPARAVRPAPVRLRPLAAPWTMMVTSACALGGITAFLPLALRAPTAAPAALFALSAAMIAGRWVAGAYRDRTGTGGLLGWGVVLSAAGVGGLAVAAGPPLAGPAVYATAVAAATAYGLGFGAVQNDTLVVMFHRAGPRGHGTASAVWNIAFDAGTGVGAVATGALAQAFDISGAFLAAAALIAVGAPLAWYDGRRDRDAAR